MKLKQKLFLLLISFVVFLIAIVNIGFINKDEAREISQIRNIILDAIESTQSLPQLPEPYNLNSNIAVPENIISKHREKIISTLKIYYSDKSPVLKRKTESLILAVESQNNLNDDFRSLGGGVEKIENLNVDFNGNEAVAEADLTVWAKIYENGKIYTPRGKEHYVFTLTKENGIWKIVDEQFNFLPGEGP